MVRKSLSLALVFVLVILSTSAQATWPFGRRANRGVAYAPVRAATNYSPRVYATPTYTVPSATPYYGVTPAPARRGWLNGGRIFRGGPYSGQGDTMRGPGYSSSFGGGVGIPGMLGAPGLTGIPPMIGG
jgi:hypothetical protein